MNNKEQIVETAAMDDVKKKAVIDIEKSNEIKIELKEFHSKMYLEKLKETKYKNKKVIFILPNGKEYK